MLTFVVVPVAEGPSALIADGVAGRIEAMVAELIGAVPAATVASNDPDD